MSKGGLILFQSLEQNDNSILLLPHTTNSKRISRSLEWKFLGSYSHSHTDYGQSQGLLNVRVRAPRSGNKLEQSTFFEMIYTFLSNPKSLNQRRNGSTGRILFSFWQGPFLRDFHCQDRLNKRCCVEHVAYTHYVVSTQSTPTQVKK